MITRRTFSGLLAAPFILKASAHATEGGLDGELSQIVDPVIRSVMGENNIPGMAVGLSLRGKRHYFNYGIASRESGKTVTENTIFELGSISKIFTATLASYAHCIGALSLSDKASSHLPALKGTSFDEISMLDLGTYTAGGLPLQFPDDVSDYSSMLAFYRNWRPSYQPGSHRQYSNPSIGLFGYLAAKSMNRSFEDAVQLELLPNLGLTNTFINVPSDRMDAYAYGYSKEGKATRVSPGMLDAEAYGIKSCSSDMLHFLEAIMGSSELSPRLQSAIETTHTGYYRIGNMVQGLGWERYSDHMNLAHLLEGNSREMAFEANKVDKISPPQKPQSNMLVNKTGSTNGFGAYVASIPSKKFGIVLLANKNYPISARVEAAYRILETQLEM